jgi:hypothetical protein
MVPIHSGKGWIHFNCRDVHSGGMTEFELELAALRQRRQSSGFVAFFRGLRPFDRRAIREPDARDAYWVTVQRRLAESDAAFLTRHDPYESMGPADR